MTVLDLIYIRRRFIIKDFRRNFGNRSSVEREGEKGGKGGKGKGMKKKAI